MHRWGLGTGDWGLGTEDWGLGTLRQAQCIAGDWGKHAVVVCPIKINGTGH
ncbi:MAG: hypothetical protein ACFKPT_22700 [Gloeotrichia echinulata GP01]